MARLWSTTGFMVAVVLSACGKGGDTTAATAPKMDTPRATADAVARAFKDRSAKEAVALLPSDDLVKKFFDCPGNEIITRITAKRQNAPKEFEKVPPDMQVAIGEFDKQGTEEKLYKAGEEYEGCKARGPVTVHKSRLELAITKDGKMEYDGETWRFVKFGEEEKWYWLD